MNKIKKILCVFSVFISSLNASSRPLIAFQTDSSTPFNVIALLGGVAVLAQNFSRALNVENILSMVDLGIDEPPQSQQSFLDIETGQHVMEALPPESPTPLIPAAEQYVDDASARRIRELEQENAAMKQEVLKLSAEIVTLKQYLCSPTSRDDSERAARRNFSTSISVQSSQSEFEVIEHPILPSTAESVAANDTKR